MVENSNEGLRGQIYHNGTLQEPNQRSSGEECRGSEVLEAATSNFLFAYESVQRLCNRCKMIQKRGVKPVTEIGGYVPKWSPTPVPPTSRPGLTFPDFRIFTTFLPTDPTPW